MLRRYYGMPVYHLSGQWAVDRNQNQGSRDGPNYMCGWQKEARRASGRYERSGVKHASSLATGLMMEDWCFGC